MALKFNIRNTVRKMKSFNIHPLMFNFKLSACYIIFIFLLSPASAAGAKERIRIAGSSTVFPFVAVAAEEYSRATGRPSPVIESTGTGGGFNLFCSSDSTNAPIINNASRNIKHSEQEKCQNNGITAITEFKIGYDGLAVANNADAPAFSLTSRQLYKATAKYIINNGKIIENPFKRWSDIDSSLPDTPISVYGPPSTSGTRDAFTELVSLPECMASTGIETAFPDKAERKKKCKLMREDGGFIDSTENDNLIIQKLRANPSALGIFGFSFLEQNSYAIRGANINGVEPTYDNIASGRYPLIRPLYVYANAARVNGIPGAKSFLTELLSENALGEDGYLTFKGLIPLSKSERDENLKSLLRM